MQAEMSVTYDAIASELDVILVPVGDIWAVILLEDPTLSLWSSDNLHASLEGSYLTACMFYLHIFHESPVGLEFYGGLDEEVAQMYQQFVFRLSVPQNLQISMSGLQINLNWESVFNSGFNIYSSDTQSAAFPEEWFLETTEPLTENYWNTEATESKRFFRVTNSR